VKQLGRQQYRAALWALVLIVLVTSSLSTITGAQAGSPANYTLTGSVETGNGISPVPNGTQVDLISRATGEVFTTTVSTGGGYRFTTASTGGALVPGYWGISVPAEGNASLPACNPVKPYQCAILPTNQTPVFQFENATALTTVNYPFPPITRVAWLPYAGNITGIVNASGGQPAPGAQVSLLDPSYDGLVLASNTTNSKGAFQLNAPLTSGSGYWVLKTTLPGPQYNVTKVSVPTRTRVTVNPTVQNYIVSGFMNLKTGGHVPTAGNLTLYDATDGFLYTSPTAPQGYYSAGTYPANFDTGTQNFNVILNAIGYGTVWYPLSVTSNSAVQKNVVLAPLSPSELGSYQTTLNFTGINAVKGTGNLTVNTVATLGNDTVLPNLPNATVGQLWAQLGLDFNHSASIPAASLPSVASWVNLTGPFFPAVQAGTTMNGTGFVGPTAPQTLASWSTTCKTGFCGLSTGGELNYTWSQTYALNKTVPANSSTYSIAFGFAHPSSTSDVYNYTVDLPAGYVLAAGTQAPSGTRLSAAGEGGAWTSFTLQSLPSATSAGSATFSIVKYAALTAIVNATVSNFAFSSENVLNSTNGNYTVEVGVGQNVSFSALHTLYPAGTNGTKFSWAFGDGGTAVTSNATTNHTYTAATSSPLTGTLTVTSSGGLVDATTFHVWVAQGPVTAVISSNASAKENKTSGTTPYLFVNWGTVLYFNASASTATITTGASESGVLSVASFALVSSHGFKQTANYSVAQGAYFGSNATFQFLGAGSYLSSGTVAGTSIPFLGWQYNLTLTVWSGTGQSAKTTLVILVNDTEKPVAAIQVLTASGKPVSASGVVAGSNLTANVLLNGANATDPHNGSVVSYYWLITNSGNSTVHKGYNVTSVKPYPSVWLAAMSTAYKVNLTVKDRNGNSGYTTLSLTVSQNTSTTPIMSATNLTGPASVTEGSSSTYRVNITVGGGSKSVAQNVSVAFYLLSPSGTGSRSYIGGSPSSVKFYNYTSSGVVNTASFATGLIATLAWNTTVRAEISWTPGATGNFNLYANATASNEFSGDYHSGPQTAVKAISVGPNPTTQLLEYVAIGVAVVVVLVLLVLYYRRRTGRGAAKSSSGRSGLERGKKPADEDEEDEEK